MRVGVAHHLGWAIVVTADDGHRVVDRRRIELVAPDLPAAPIHHQGGPYADREVPLGDDELVELVRAVRSCAVVRSGRALDELVATVGSVSSLSLRDWPDDAPTDVATLRRVPHESRADSEMYRTILAELARDRGWLVHRYGRDVETEARRILGDRAVDVLDGPRRRLGPPWTKDHRTALAATVVAAI